MKPAALACIYALLCVGHTGFAQADSQRRVAIVVSPALLMPVTVAVQVGVQIRLNERFAVLLEAAAPTFQPGNTEFENIRSLRTGFEFKYYMRQKPGATHYVSLQSNYLFRQFTETAQGNYFTRTERFVYNDAIIQSPVLSLAVKRGVELAVSKRLYVDVFGGLGVRTIFTKYQTKTALSTGPHTVESGFFDYDAAWQYNYTLMRLHATAGIRLGWRL